jgi:tetratricopeptide (TPR) repeat protein
MNDQGDRFARGMLPGEEYYLQSIRLKKELDLQNTSKKSETLTMEQERAKRNAERQPMIFMIMAHEAGFPKASFELGFYYLQLNDTEQAKECFTKAKEKGIKGAEEQLSKLA